MKDIKFYLSVRNVFNFDGASCYVNKKGEDIVQYSDNGVDFITAFKAFDTNGTILPTRHPTTLAKLLKTKGSVNLHIKMYSEDRSNGVLPFFDFVDICSGVKAPLWFVKAVEKQKNKLLSHIPKEYLDYQFKQNLEYYENQNQ